MALLVAVVTPVLGVARALPQPAGITGHVIDSLSGRPLAGATVQFTRADTGSAPARMWSALTDSAGRYRIADVPPGRYLAGFFHPHLDSLGFGSAARVVEVDNETTRADFAIPPASTIAAVVCPERPPDDSSALLIGHVRSADAAAPLAGATVVASWTELVQEAVLVKAREREIAVSTTSEGWFALCGVPGESPVLVRAALSADSSGYVRLSLPARGLAHQVLHVDAGGLPSARVSGAVRDGQGRPVAGAEVQVWGTERRAASAATGAFVIDSLRAGTQTLEARAVGYLPVTRVVHVSRAEPLDVAIVLAERVTTLPTTTVRARGSTSLRMRSFYQRMAEVEKGINRGYFFTPEDLERRKPPVITNLFDGLPGIWVMRNPLQPGRAVVKGPIQLGGAGNASRCDMAVFLDGIQILGGIGIGDDPIDRMVVPSDVAAVEVYPHPVSAPPQYQSLNGTCGVILIWTK
jgi:hypothetical protein